MLNNPSKKGLENNVSNGDLAIENMTFKSTIENTTGDFDQSLESLRQLNNDTFPVYSPRDLTLIQKYGFEIFNCPGCESKFVCQSSINYHLNRRSILVKFKCDSCTSIQVFYNRCSLHAHINSHAEKNEPSDIHKAIVSTLPRALMQIVPTDPPLPQKNNQTFLDPKDDNEPEHLKLLEVSITEGKESQPIILESQPIIMESQPMIMDSQPIIMESQPIIMESLPIAETVQAMESKTYRCSECDSEFNTFEERQDHLTNKDKLPSEKSCCTKCGILCPSECSVKAHKRLHLQVSPYVCPECGDNPDRYWENFQKHLTYHCFHYSRSFGYKCALCSELLLTTELLKQHTIANHIEILYKCQMCPMAFTNFTSFQVHKRKGHAAEMVMNNLSEAIQMYKCVTCDLVFLSKEESDQHCDSHLTEIICKYAFRCSECNKVVETKADLRHHMKSHHVELYEKNATLLSPLPESSVLHKAGNELNCNKVECLLCHAVFSSRQGLSVHVTKSHSNRKYPCGVCGKITINRAEMVSHGKEHLTKNFSLCLLCHNKSMRQSETLDSHLLNHVERLSCQTICPFCDILLSSSNDTIEHLRFEHLLKSFHPKTTESSWLSLGSKKEKTFVGESDSRVLKLPKSANFNGKNENTSNAARFILHGIAWTTRLQTGENTCVKCNLKSSHRKTFKDHLLTHQVKKSTYQCQECGLCFVVEPSLKRHLRIAHKIVQVDQYLAEEGSNYLPEAETVPEINKTNDLECNVCYEVFATEMLLKTHMRKHGMAFIQAKKNSLI